MQLTFGSSLPQGSGRARISFHQPRRVVLLLVLVVDLGFTSPNQVSQDDLAPQAKTYLEDAISIMKENHLHRDAVDWDRLQQDTMAKASGAQQPADTYDAIRFALDKLADRHSYLQLTPELSQQEAARKVGKAASLTMGRKPTVSIFKGRSDPEGQLLSYGQHSVALIVVPFFLENDGDAFATRIQNIISDLSLKHPCGWIVDLRGNNGGNMWPMLAGVGPLLGADDVGAFVTRGGQRTNWSYFNGRAGDSTVLNKPASIAGTPPVAVLIDNGTASSGEAIAIAFHGRAATRFFGEHTFGVSTATNVFPLADRAKLFLVVATYSDRTGKECDLGLAPDEEIK